ncbi:MAG: VPLPA-CTERM sorting domain-containing protein [Rhodobacteraceae bacterium]|nr:VPLPA-CTERM sorting domain-containing protein [Paracoccaceae bacterium]
MVINTLMKFGAAALLALGLSASASSAVTVISDGGVYATGAGLETQFIGNIAALGGPGSWSVTFEANRDATAEAIVTIGGIVASTFEGLTLSWLNAADNSLLASVPVLPTETSLSSVFLAPGTLSQILQVSWLNSLDGAGFGIEVAVSPVPLPFAGALLLTGLGGLVLVRRRQTA